MKRPLGCLGAVLLAGLISATPALADRCRLTCNGGPEVGASDGALTAAYFELRYGIGYASNTSEGVRTHEWRLRAQCDVTDSNVGGCDPAQLHCPEPPDRLIGYYLVQFQRLVPPDRSP